MALTAYQWEARAKNGDVKKGVMEADSEDAVLNRLKLQLLSPIEVKKQPKQITLRIGSGVKTDDIVIFTRLFATMIDAGLPIVQCLDILSSQAKNKYFGKILGQVKSGVEGGLTLSDSLRKHPKIFDNLFVNLVAAGEAGGILDTILQRLSIYIEKAMKLKRRVKGAMMYPISVLCIAGIAGFFSLKAALKTRKGLVAFDGMLLKLPVLGPVLRKVIVARFTRTMGTLLSSGVPILDAMDIVARTAGNKVVQDGIMYVRAKISEGKDLATPLMETGLMPPMVVQMIAVGEQTGALDTMLSKIA